MTKLIILRTRAGTKNTTLAMRETLQRLGLPACHSCSLHEDTPVIKGMLMKVEHLITWGPISETTTKKIGTLRRLHPPRGGFERKGIKLPFTKGGVYGNRGEKINDLVERMLP